MKTSIWNVDSLKEYVDKQFAYVQSAAERIERETKENKAQSNEWRGAMNDKDRLREQESAKFALKADTERIETAVQNLQLSEAKLSGMATNKDVNRAQNIAVISAIFTALGIIIAVLTLIYK